MKGTGACTGTSRSPEARITQATPSLLLFHAAKKTVLRQTCSFKELLPPFHLVVILHQDAVVEVLNEGSFKHKCRSTLVLKPLASRTFDLCVALFDAIASKTRLRRQKKCDPRPCPQVSYRLHTNFKSTTSSPRAKVPRYAKLWPHHVALRSPEPADTSFK